MENREEGKRKERRGEGKIRDVSVGREERKEGFRGEGKGGKENIQDKREGEKYMRGNYSLFISPLSVLFFPRNTPEN